MVLSMPSPFKHPFTGVYWYRQRVPTRLLQDAKGRKVIVNVDGLPSTLTLGAELKVSLRTKDPARAKRLGNEVQAEFDRIWLSLEQRPANLTYKQIVALAGELYHSIRSVLEDNPGQLEIWEGHKLARAERQQDEERHRTSPFRSLMIPPSSSRDRLGSWVEGALAERHLNVDDVTFERLLVEFDRVGDELIDLFTRRASGDYGKDEAGERFPAFEPAMPSLPQVQAEGPSLSQLADIWANRMSAPKSQTIKTYRSIIEQFITFLGHDRALEVTDMDVVRWHEELVGDGAIIHSTFIKKHRAALSTVYTYSMEPQGRLALNKLGQSAPTINPAKVRLEGERRTTSRPKQFTSEEARRILSAALRAQGVNNNFAAFNRAAQRWVPWICAYTGARAGKVCQLRKQDFIEIDGVRCIALLPDAGTIKSGKFRYVPLHPALLDQGLWAFAQEAAPGPLFFNPELKSQQPWKQTVQMLGEWVRETAHVSDPEIGPNHAWRHWFKSKGRTAGIPDSYLDVICGHAMPAEGRKYGEYEPPALLRELIKLPPVSLEKPTIGMSETA